MSSNHSGPSGFIPFPVRAWLNQPSKKTLTTIVPPREYVLAWLGSTVHLNNCRCVRCKELNVNGYAPKTSLELHYDVLEKIEKENTR